jgi:glycosyltransferase 2 family protein
MNELALKKAVALPAKEDRSKLWFCFRLGFGAFLLIILFRMIDFERLWLTLTSANLQLIVVGLLAMMLNFLVKTYRWGSILRIQSSNISFIQLARLNFLSLFIGNFLPTSLSYDIVRIYYVSQRAADPRIAISSIVADRVIGNLSIGISAILAFGILKFAGPLQIETLLSLGIVVFLLLSLALPLALWNEVIVEGVRSLLNRFTGRRLFESVQDLAEHLLLYWKQAPLMSTALALAFLNLLIAVLEFYLIAQAFSAQVSLGYFFLFIPLVILLSMLPVSVGGIGLVEAGLVFFFAKVGMPAEMCLSIALIHRALQLICVLPGGAIYVVESVPRIAT